MISKTYTWFSRSLTRQAINDGCELKKFMSYINSILDKLINMQIKTDIDVTSKLYLEESCICDFSFVMH